MSTADVDGKKKKNKNWVGNYISQYRGRRKSDASLFAYVLKKSAASFASVSPLSQLWTRYFKTEWIDFDANWRKWSAGRETTNLRGQGVED